MTDFQELRVADDGGEWVCEFNAHMLHVSFERPAYLDQPPYMCVQLALDSYESNEPARRNYAITAKKRDWSDMEPDPEMGCSLPMAAVREIVLGKLRPAIEQLFSEAVAKRDKKDDPHISASTYSYWKGYFQGQVEAYAAVLNDSSMEKK